MARLLSKNRNPLYAEFEGPAVSIAGPIDTPMPDGIFPLILCVTAEQVTRLMSAAGLGAVLLYESDAETMAPLYDALNNLDAPACLPEGDSCEDDIWADAIAAMADGVLVNTLEGGAMQALGYEIEAEGTIEAATALPLIALSFLALGAAYVVSIALGGLPLGAVTVAAGEAAEIILFTGASEAAPAVITAIAALAA